MSIEDLMMHARAAKETAFHRGDEFVPLVEMGYEDDPQMMVFFKASSEEKDTLYESLAECLFVFCLQGYDTFRFVSDAFMSLQSKEEYEDGDRPRPSQDPEATEVIVITEWKKGEARIHYNKYHISDDDNGHILWGDADDHTADGGRISDMIQDAVDDPPEGAPFPNDHVAHELLQRKGHIVMVPA
jgi:hypothetical protein